MKKQGKKTRKLLPTKPAPTSTISLPEDGEGEMEGSWVSMSQRDPEEVRRDKIRDEIVKEFRARFFSSSSGPHTYPDGSLNSDEGLD